MRIHPVFIGEEADEHIPLLARPIHIHDVAAGAEGPALGLYENTSDCVVPLPCIQRGSQRMDHVLGERIERPGTRQRDHTGLAADFETDLIAATKIHCTRFPRCPC